MRAYKCNDIGYNGYIEFRNKKAKYNNQLVENSGYELLNLNKLLCNIFYNSNITKKY